MNVSREEKPEVRSPDLPEEPRNEPSRQGASEPVLLTDFHSGSAAAEIQELQPELQAAERFLKKRSNNPSTWEFKANLSCLPSASSQLLVTPASGDAVLSSGHLHTCGMYTPIYT